MKIILFKKSRIVTMSLIIAVYCTVMIAVFGGYQNFVAAIAPKRELPIYCVKSDEKKVAISFDAAWGNIIIRTNA